MVYARTDTCRWPVPPTIGKQEDMSSADRARSSALDTAEGQIIWKSGPGGKVRAYDRKMGHVEECPLVLEITELLPFPRVEIQTTI